MSVMSESDTREFLPSRWVRARVLIGNLAGDLLRNANSSHIGRLSINLCSRYFRFRRIFHASQAFLKTKIERSPPPSDVPSSPSAWSSSSPPPPPPSSPSLSSSSSSSSSPSSSTPCHQHHHRRRRHHHHGQHEHNRYNCVLCRHSHS